MRTWVMIGLIILLGLSVTGARKSKADINRVCPNVRINEKGTSNADITINNTAGGVTVLDASTARCAALIINVSNPIRCAPSTGAGAFAPTATAGLLIQAGTGLGLAIEDGAQNGWKCIRTTASDSTVSVAEGRFQ